MDETTKSIVERVAIRFPKPTRVPSGHVCSVFFDCFQLTPSDNARLAADAVGHLEHDAFDIVVGIAYSGIHYSAAVAGGRKVVILQKDGRFFGPDLKGLRVMVVDDVVFSGRHMLEAAEKIESEGGLVVGYTCIIDRSSGKFPDASTGAVQRPLWSAFQTDME